MDENAIFLRSLSFSNNVFKEKTLFEEQIQ